MDTNPPRPDERQKFRPLYHQRTERGLTREEVAAYLSVSVDAIRKAETTDPYAIGLQKYLLLAQWWLLPLDALGPPKYRLLALMENAS